MAATSKAIITDEIKKFIQQNIDKKPKAIAMELGVEVEKIRWHIWNCKKNLTFDFDCCPITGFKNYKNEIYAR